MAEFHNETATTPSPRRGPSRPWQLARARQCLRLTRKIVLAQARREVTARRGAWVETQTGEHCSCTFRKGPSAGRSPPAMPLVATALMGTDLDGDGTGAGLKFRSRTSAARARRYASRLGRVRPTLARAPVQWHATPAELGVPLGRLASCASSRALPEVQDRWDVPSLSSSFPAPSSPRRPR